jgi:putative heme-binding domain-containing protein
MGVFFLVLTLCILSKARPESHAQTPADRGQTQEGAALFALNCASTYCHGEGGKGGGAPGLRDRTLAPEDLRHLILAGIPGTAMPSFGSRFTSSETDDLVAYLVSLSGRQPGVTDYGPLAATRQGQQGQQGQRDATRVVPDAESNPASGSVGSGGGLVGDVEAGRSLFFDAAAIDSCRVCHTFEGRGGKVGPDLTQVRAKSAREIFESIINPSARLDSNYSTVNVTTRDGRRQVGVRRDENEDRLRLFDTSTMPPVSRAIPRTEIVSVERTLRSAMPDNFGTRFSEKQLLDLVAFLKASRQAITIEEVK